LKRIISQYSTTVQGGTVENFDFEGVIERPVEVPEPKRKRKKFRKYPRPPELTLDQKRELLKVQGGL
jgi:hypothetical protein